MTTNRSRRPQSLPKSPTGIQGLDEITGGGLPKGRPTLISGSAGSGKTMIAMEFLIHGAQEYNEPGVFMAFEENAQELARNVRSLGYDLDALSRKKKLLVDYVRVERSEIEETGEYDLEALFVRLNYAIDSIGANRVVLDTIEALFSGLPNHAILRAELRRLFRWLKDKGVTAIITGERGETTLTRYGLEEYVADCVIMLDHRVNEQVSTRRLRIVKYRGSAHGTNEYPFLIDKDGVSVFPISSVRLDHDASSERISTGSPRLDTMLGGKGLYRGSSVLITGMAGTGKTSVALHIVDAACARGERALFFAFEESPQQIIRNSRSIGIDLEQWVKQGLLRFHSSRPSLYGLEMHLATMHREIKEFRPRVVVADPITSLAAIGTPSETHSMLMRLIDYLKAEGVTSVSTALTAQGGMEDTSVAVSSVMDTWILLRNLETYGERNRALYILKSRGMAHSNQVREFLITDHGVELRDAYVGSSGVLMGTARAIQEAAEKADAVKRREEAEQAQHELERKKVQMETEIESLRTAFKVGQGETRKQADEAIRREKSIYEDRAEMARLRKADPDHAENGKGRERKKR